MDSFLLLRDPSTKTSHVITYKVSEVKAMTQSILFPYKGSVVSFSFVFPDWHHRIRNYRQIQQHQNLS